MAETPIRCSETDENGCDGANRPHDTAAGNETDLQPAAIDITNDCIDKSISSLDQSQPTMVNGLGSNDDKEACLDWNGNKSSEVDCAGDLAVVPATERAGDVQQSHVHLNAEEVSVSEKAMETQDGMPDSVTVAMVTASPSYSASPATNVPDDDIPPPLPISLPPSSMCPALDQDTSQELSMLLVQDEPQTTEEIISPPSPYATSQPEDTSLINESTAINPGTEQSHTEDLSHNEDLSQEGSSEKYGALSEEDQLLIQKMLKITQGDCHALVASGETATEKAVNQEDTNDQSGHNHSDLSESERKLIENTLASLGQRQLDEQNGVHEEIPTDLAELQTEGCACQESGGNTCNGGAEKESATLTEMETQRVSQVQDEKRAEEAIEEYENVSAVVDNENVSLAGMRTEDSSQHERNQETNKDINEETVDVLVGTTVAEEPCTIAERTVMVIPEPKDVADSENEQPESMNTEGGPVDSYLEHHSESTGVPPEKQINADECTGAAEPGTLMDSKATDDVFCTSTDSVSADAPTHVETDALSKSRRVVMSDVAVSEILQEYYRANDETEEQQPEKPKPEKPVIAQALLPKTSRRPVTFGASTAVADSATVAQTSGSFSDSKPRYGQVEVPLVVSLSGEPGSRTTRDNQSLKPVIELDSDDVTHGVDVVQSTTSDAERADGRPVPTIAESRAFFKSREAAMKNDHTSSAHRHPMSESSSTPAFNQTQTTSRSEDGESHAAALPTQSQAKSAAESFRLQRRFSELPNINDSRVFKESINCRGGSDGIASTSRVPLTTRWTPKPFLLAASASKATPTFVTFEPKLPTDKTSETSVSGVPMDRPAITTNAGSGTSSTLAENSSARIRVETATTEPKPKLGPSLPTKTAEAAGSVERPSAADDSRGKQTAQTSSIKTAAAECGEKRTSKSSDVDIDIGSVIVPESNVTAQASELQHPHGTHHHHPMSAAAIATELKKKGPTRPASTSGPVHSLIHPPHPSSGLGRSCSTSEVDVQPTRRVHKWTNRGSASPAKSWTQFDCRKTAALPARTETVSSTTVGGQDGKAADDRNGAVSSVEENVEHISVASSKAFFEAVEQASNQPVSRNSRGKQTSQTSSVKAAGATECDDVRSATAVEPALSSSSESSYSAHSAPPLVNSGEQSLYCFVTVNV